MSVRRSLLPQGTQIQIESCRDPLLWYCHLNGDVFEAEYIEIDSTGEKYWVRTKDYLNTRNWVHVEDARLL